MLIKKIKQCSKIYTTVLLLLQNYGTCQFALSSKFIHIWLGALGTVSMSVTVVQQYWWLTWGVLSMVENEKLNVRECPPMLATHSDWLCTLREIWWIATYSSAAIGPWQRKGEREKGEKIDVCHCTNYYILSGLFDVTGRLLGTFLSTSWPSHWSPPRPFWPSQSAPLAPAPSPLAPVALALLGPITPSPFVLWGDVGDGDNSVPSFFFLFFFHCPPVTLQPLFAQNWPLLQATETHHRHKHQAHSTHQHTLTTSPSHYHT